MSDSNLKFKKLRKKPELRQIEKNAQDEENENISHALEELKEIQKLRRKCKGISAAALAVGNQGLEDEQIIRDPFQVKTGGIVDMQVAKKSSSQSPDDAYETGIGTTFSVETNARDEDDDMRRYIDEQLAKRKGCIKQDSQEERKYLLPEEAALFAVPEHLRKSSSKKSEEMLSNQMLSGIPEVDLGIESKIKNIEATEEAKVRLLQEKLKQKDLPSEFVPSNMAVNFMHHSRFNLDGRGPMKTSWNSQESAPKFNLKRSSTEEKATDDFHYEKFRKQFKRQ